MAELAAGELVDVNPPTDRRLQAAVAALEESSFDIVSLDVFDTILWRTVPEPVDAFVLIGGRLRELGLLNESIEPASFARLRQRAEQKARADVATRGQVPEIGLQAIYAALPAWMLTPGTSPSALVDVEVDVEREITVVDLEVAAFAAYAQQKHGARLVCVSDTYFSEDHLRRLLDRPALAALEFERIFVSSQYRKGKATGIWELVLEQLDAEPSRLLHIGDHAECDDAIPNGLGVRAFHFPQRSDQLRTVLEREGVIDRLGPGGEKPLLDPVAGDFGLTALRSKAAAKGDGQSPYWEFGATVLGPVFSAFAEWVLERAVADGVDTVYCVMREGEFMSRLVDGHAVATDVPVRARTLWLSRDVTSRAALVDASIDELRGFLYRRVAPTVGGLAASLGLELGDFPAIAPLAASRIDHPEIGPTVLELLSTDEQARARIIATAAALRQRLLEHVMTVTGGAERLLMVDLGWGGTIQERFDVAMRAAGAPVETTGLYLLTNDGATDKAIDGVHAEGFLASYGRPDVVSRWVVRSPEILEQVCMCDHGSLADFTDDGEPIEGPQTIGAVQSLQRVALQNGVLAFQHERLRYRNQLPDAARSLVPARALLRKTLTRFVVQPTAEEAAIFGAWEHDENFGSHGTETIVRPGIGPSLRHMTPKQLLDVPMTALYWPFGAAATYNPPLAMAAAALLDGTVPEEVFATGDPVPVRLLIDQGRWVDAGTTDVEASAAGSYLLRRNVTAPRFRNLAFRFGAEPGVVRLDWLTVTFRLGDGDPVHVELRGDELGALKYRECIPLGPNLAIGTRQGPEVVYRVPAELSERAYDIVIELAFGWLSTGPLAGAPPTNIEAALYVGRKVASKAKNVMLNAKQEAYGRFRGRG